MNAGRHTQKVLVIAKLVGLLLLIGAGLSTSSPAAFVVTRPIQGPGWSLAMILVLYAYGGWNDAAFVTAEVRDRTRNIPRSLLFGLGLISLIYALVNLAYLRALGFEGLRNSALPAADAFSVALGEDAGRVMSLLVVISALGGLNGLILAVSRVHATVGEDHALFAWLGHWSKRTRTPMRSLFVQGLVTVLMIAGVGTESGRVSINEASFGSVLCRKFQGKFYGGFDVVCRISADLLAVLSDDGVAYFVLRFVDRDHHRPFKEAAFFNFAQFCFAACRRFGFLIRHPCTQPTLLPLILTYHSLWAHPVIRGQPMAGKRREQAVADERRSADDCRNPTGPAPVVHGPLHKPVAREKDQCRPIRT